MHVAILRDPTFSLVGKREKDRSLTSWCDGSKHVESSSEVARFVLLIDMLLTLLLMRGISICRRLLAVASIMMAILSMVSSSPTSRVPGDAYLAGSFAYEPGFQAVVRVIMSFWGE